MRRLSGAALAVVLSCSIFATAGAAAPNPGDRDNSFSGDGKALIDFGSNAAAEIATDVMITSSGKSVVVAQVTGQESVTRFAVSRLRQDGSPDRQFSGDGRVVTTLGEEAVPHVVATLGDGAILVGGRSVSDSALVAFRSDGKLKQSFGGGIVTDDLVEGSEVITDLQVQGDGAVLAAGLSLTGGFVARYLPNGSLDEEYGDGGVVVTDPAFAGVALATRAKLDPDGRLLVIGRGQVDEETDVDPWAVARFDENGDPDADFGGGDGLVETSFSSEFCCHSNLARDAVVQPDGAIVVVGSSFGEEVDEMLTMARYTSAGVLDEEFGDAGKRILGHGFVTAGHAVALTPSGKIVVAGKSSWSYDPMFIARFRTDGSNDPKFGVDGIREVYYPSKRGVAAYAVAVRDGRILAAGAAPTTGDGPQQAVVPVIRLFS